MNKSRSINIKKIEIKHQSIWIKVLLYTIIYIWKLEKSAICFKDSTPIKSVIKAHFNGNGKKGKVYITLK